MQRRQNKWNCESIKITKTEITDTEFNEKLERLWELLQSLERQPQELFHPKNNIDDPSLQDPEHYRRSA